MQMGTIARWEKKEGDKISEGDLIAEVFSKGIQASDGVRMIMNARDLACGPVGEDCAGNAI